MVTVLWYTYAQNFRSLSWLRRCKEHPCPLSHDLGLCRMLDVPDWGLASWYWFGYGHLSLVHPYSEFWLSILILKVQRTSMSFKSWSGALEDAGGSWLGFGNLDLDLDMVKNLAWIFYEVLILLRSVEAQIQGLSKSQISSDKLVPVWSVGLGRVWIQQR